MAETAGKSAQETLDEAAERRFVLGGASDPRPILAVLHQEMSTTGRVGQILQSHGVALDIRRPVMGDALPETLENHRGAIIFGGPPSANDDEPYLRQEIEWLKVPLEEKRPYLGICLGAQMLAKHLGAEVGPRSDDMVEIGYYPLSTTTEGRRLMPHWPSMVYQWHREGFDLPSGASLLATGDRFPNQAFQYGETAFGVQFHAELTLAMLHRWTTRGHERTLLPGAQKRRQHFDGRAIYDAPVRRWLEDFLAHIFGEPAKS
ncbi:glutamine amidotransferase [Consotaella salsifontis]|uniref:GMP synthase (Glutamine-hydrolysing) n=1 Tax=Consotaella salsifontis TaxID=1365950 RepID=A0A1T4QS14_9HYPH|nr:glutamine amidotransferase [Consotaella salsifontis]SKA06484.1 GMP synthase (glutamine-hydrolysing) [Consotaella salsifontis]